MFRIVARLSARARPTIRLHRADDVSFLVRQDVGLDVIDIELAGDRLRCSPTVCGYHDDPHAGLAQHAQRVHRRGLDRVVPPRRTARRRVRWRLVLGRSPWGVSCARRSASRRRLGVSRRFKAASRSIDPPEFAATARRTAVTARSLRAASLRGDLVVRRRPGRPGEAPVPPRATSTRRAWSAPRRRRPGGRGSCTARHSR